MTTPPICDYEGSDYQTSFWERGGREYEDRAESIALRRLLPKQGQLLLELGAGAGRNTPRYTGFDRIVLLDYSRTQLEQAQQRLGKSDRYVFVAADVYRLPFVDRLFDAATMIRVLHHMVDAPKALGQVSNVLESNGTFVLEYANKLNLKAILRYVLRRQAWSPFTLEPVEFAKLNFDFHPKAVHAWLHSLGFRIEETLALSYFRVDMLKKLLPTRLLVWLDALLQRTGAWWQLSPSVFVKAVRRDAQLTPSQRGTAPAGQDTVLSYFKCPGCRHSPLIDRTICLECSNCGTKWDVKDGIYDFRAPIP